ncbi:putative sterigmatocystin biosynthesis monooxygenase stcW [Fonsecaea pedrosoi]|nr:putative sterigmatocystin biosynthesis monooxygenase stcW [Fonsecaea pedrosoi]
MGSLGTYQVPEWYHSEVLRPIKVICIGAGISGLCLAYKMMTLLDSFELTIYEKNDDVGGTWLENRYPGCACDIPAHIYTFTFDPKPDWSEYYAGSKEIHGYCRGFYEKHNIAQFTKLSHVVKEAVWDENTSKWRLEIEDRTSTPSRIFRDECDVLINGAGFLNKWSWPNIPGIETFQKPKLHSARWDASLDLKNKTVGLIGNGSSGIQILPQIAKDVAKLKVFMRSPTWISPALGGSVALQFQDEHGGEHESTSDANPGSTKGNKHEQFTFTEEEKEQFRADPQAHLQFRRRIEAEMNVLTDMFINGSSTQQQMHKFMVQQMKDRMGPGNEELKAKIIPQWAPGCRRITPGDGYLETLVQPHVEPIFGEIHRLTETAVQMVDGTLHDVDVLVCATGFDTSFIPPFPVIGRGGVSMETAWKNIPDAYLGIAAPGFPNYFMTTGPQGPLGNGTILPAIETACEYFITVMKKMQEEKIRSVEPKRRATDQFHEHMSAFHKKTVWGLPCRSWYKNGTVDGEPQLWCGSALTYVKTIKVPRFEDYEFEYENSNQWAFLGNGKIKAFYEQVDGKPNIDGLAPYIRNEDSPWII